MKSIEVCLLHQPNTFSQSFFPVGVTARPPSAVSFSVEDIVSPIFSRYNYLIRRNMAFHACRASSAATRALPTPPAFLLIQGISTRPATGSQTRPRIFFSAIAQAAHTAWVCRRKALPLPPPPLRLPRRILPDSRLPPLPRGIRCNNDTNRRCSKQCHNQILI